MIDWVELPGDPTQEPVWQDLDALLLRPITNRFGRPMKVVSAAVDCGYLTDDVLKFVRAREHRHVFAVKGSSVPGRQSIGTAQKQDDTAKGKKKKRGVKIWMVGGDGIKQAMFLWLQQDEKLNQIDRRVRFSDELPDEYYSQLCAEIYDPHKRKWVKQQTRNEALDTFVYAVAAARHAHLRVHTMGEADWRRWEAAMEPTQGDLLDQVDALPAAVVQVSAQPESPPNEPAPESPDPLPATPEAQARKVKRAPKRGGGFVSRYK